MYVPVGAKLEEQPERCGSNTKALTKTQTDTYNATYSDTTNKHARENAPASLVLQGRTGSVETFQGAVEECSPPRPVLSHAVQTFCIQHCSVTVVLVLDLILLLLLLLLRLLLLLVAYLALLMIMLMLVRPPFSCVNGQLHQQAVTSSKLPGL
jgi:hypothetical protein